MEMDGCMMDLLHSISDFVGMIELLCTWSLGRKCLRWNGKLVLSVCELIDMFLLLMHPVCEDMSALNTLFR